MIVFELYRQLDVRMYMTVAVMDRNYGSCAKYILMDDTLLMLGTDHSVKLNMMTKEVTSDNPIRNWDIDAEPVLWFAQDSSEACVIRMINNAFRQWLEIDPFPSQSAFGEASNEINQKLAKYNLRIIYDADSICIYHDENAITFEQALELIMEIDAEQDAEASIPEWLSEAQYLRKAGQLEKAAKRYERILKHTESSQPTFTISAFELAETYYFLGNYERSVILYYRCKLKFIEDETDFYKHLGHALLDVKMKKYERQIKIFYHGRIDAEYADTHRQAVEAAGREVAEVFDEYDETCFDMGQKKYAEHRNQLPPGADDIDELLAEELPPMEMPVLPPKRYEDIRLIEQSSAPNTEGKSVNEQLADALELFIEGEYQQAFNIYIRLREELTEDTDHYTWVQYQIGKLYCIFDENQKAFEALSHCDPKRFGLVYRKEDFLVLYEHVRIVCDDFESDLRYRKLIRGKFDFYYAQYDSAYNQMLRDKKLMNDYKQYEQECMETAKRELTGETVELKGSTKAADTTEKKPFLFKNVFKFFKEK